MAWSAEDSRGDKRRREKRRGKEGVFTINNIIMTLMLYVLTPGKESKLTMN